MFDVTPLMTLLLLFPILGAILFTMLGAFIFARIGKHGLRGKTLVTASIVIAAILFFGETALLKYDLYEGDCLGPECTLGDEPERAEKGDPIAQEQMGVRYEMNFGVRQDYGEAMKWYRKAAAQGNWEAMEGIAGLYEHGYGVEQDGVAAEAWLGRAVWQCRKLTEEKGYAEDCFGRLCANNEDAATTCPAALQLRHKNANEEDSKSQMLSGGHSKPSKRPAAKLRCCPQK